MPPRRHLRGRCRDPCRATPAPVRNRASVGGARAGSGHRRYRVRQRRQDCVALRNEMVGRSRRARSDGWFAGPKADRVSSLTATELVDMGLASLAEIFELPLDRISRDRVASRAVSWGKGSAVGAEKTGWWRHILFRRGARCRSRYRHGRGAAGARTRNSADDPGRWTIGFQATALRGGLPGLPNGIHFGATGAIGEGAITTGTDHAAT
jgi:hypothetical protein